MLNAAICLDRHASSLFSTVEVGTKAVRERLERLQKLVQRLIGLECGVWSASLAWGACMTAKHIYDYSKILRETTSVSEKKLKLDIQADEIYMRIISMVGNGTAIIRWANTTRLICIDKYLFLLQMISYSCNLMISVIGVDKSRIFIKMKKTALDNATLAIDRQREKQAQRIAWFDMAAYISTLAWSVLGIVESVTAASLSPILMPSILVTSGVFTCASFVCRAYLTCQRQI